MIRSPRRPRLLCERRRKIDGGRRKGCGVGRIGSRHRGDEKPRVFGRSRERSDRVERGGQGHRAVEAHESVGRLEPRESAERRGNPDRSAGVRTDGRRGETGGHRDRGSARRPAGDAMRGGIPRVPWRTHRLIAPPAAERELDHVRLAERNHPGGEEARDRGRRGVGDASEPAFRACGGLLPADVQQVLERNRQPVERSADPSVAPFAIQRVGLRERVVAPDVDEGVQLAGPMRRRCRGTRRRFRETTLHRAPAVAQARRGSARGDRRSRFGKPVRKSTKATGNAAGCRPTPPEITERRQSRPGRGEAEYG